MLSPEQLALEYAKASNMNPRRMTAMQMVASNMMAAAGTTLRVQLKAVNLTPQEEFQAIADAANLVLIGVRMHTPKPPKDQNPTFPDSLRANTVTPEFMAEDSSLEFVNPFVSNHELTDDATRKQP